MWLPLFRNIAGSHTTLLSLLAHEHPGDEFRIDGELIGHRHDEQRHGRGLCRRLDPGQPHSVEMRIGRFDRASLRREIRTVVRAAISRGADWIMTSDAPNGAPSSAGKDTG